LDFQEKQVSRTGVIAEPIAGHHRPHISATRFDDEVRGRYGPAVGPDGSEDDVFSLRTTGFCSGCDPEQEDKNCGQTGQPANRKNTTGIHGDDGVEMPDRTGNSAGEGGPANHEVGV
jgi:hypothetical protein